MSDTEAIRQSVQSRAPLSTWLGVVLLFGLFGVMAMAIIGPSPRGDTYEQSRAQKRIEKLKALRETDAKQLLSYGWLDKNKGTVHLPIERAMELTVTDLSAKKPAPAYPIATPVPAAPQGNVTASPAPAASTQPRASPKASSVEGPKSEAKGSPAALVNPSNAQPGTQPGSSATPAAGPQSSAAVAPSSPAPVNTPVPSGSQLPVAGKSPPP